MAAQSSIVNMIAGQFQAFAFESIIVSTIVKQFTVDTLTVTTNTLAQKAVITIEDGSIRYRYDGTDPTSSVGHQMFPLDTLAIIGSINIQAFRAIRTGLADATLRITYEV